MSKIYLSAYDRIVDTKEIIGTTVREKREMDGFYSIRVGWQVDLVLTPKWYTLGKPRKVKMQKKYIHSWSSVQELKDFVADVIARKKNRNIAGHRVHNF
jgi:hypothetical protein